MNPIKQRLNIKGYNLFPVLEKMVNEQDPFMNKIIDEYGEALNLYLKSVMRGGSQVEESKPPVICGPRERLDKILAIILYMFQELQGKKFSIEDLNIIKSKKEEEYEEETFKDYEHLAIVDLHKNTIESENMERWRLEGILEQISSRQRSRKPMVLVSEKVLSDKFLDHTMFTYINLYYGVDKSKVPSAGGGTFKSEETAGTVF